MSSSPELNGLHMVSTSHIYCHILMALSVLLVKYYLSDVGMLGNISSIPCCLVPKSVDHPSIFLRCIWPSC